MDKLYLQTNMIVKSNIRVEHFIEVMYTWDVVEKEISCTGF